MSTQKRPLKSPKLATAALTLSTAILVATVSTGGSGAAGVQASVGAPFKRLLAPETVVGEVAEVLPAGGYRYVLLHTPAGDRQWVATLAGEPAPTGRVQARVFGRRQGFVSRRLDRTFDDLAFGVVSPHVAAEQSTEDPTLR